MCLRVHTTGHGMAFHMPSAYSLIVLSLENLPELATGRSRRSICTHGMADLLRRCHGCHSCAPFGRIRRLSLSNKYRQLSKLTAVKTRSLTAYGDLECLELSPDLVHRVIQLLGFVFQLLPLWIALERAKSEWREGQDELFPRNPTSHCHKALLPTGTHLQIVDGTSGVFTVSQSYAEQPVRTMREIPSHADSPYTLAASLLPVGKANLHG